jgi:cytidylate kinase
MNPTIAIDGPSGVGKSTVARGLAAALGFVYVDTGALYRAVALLADRAGVRWDDETSLANLIGESEFSFEADGTLSLDGVSVTDEIRTPRMSMGASKVAAHAAVRAALLVIQRRLGEGGGVVLEGRDVGTVVFPDAGFKFFLTASPEVRAHRRFLELRSKGTEISPEEVLADQLKRDAADRGRKLAPLKKAADAETVDCDEMTAEDVVEMMARKIQASFPLTSK